MANELSKETLQVTAVQLTGDGKVMFTVARLQEQSPQTAASQPSNQYSAPPTIGQTSQFFAEKDSTPKIGQEVEVTVTLKGGK